MKVTLPGESPWAEVLEVFHDGTWVGRIDNHLLGSLPDWSDDPAKRHGYRYNDVVYFRQDDNGLWVPSEDQLMAETHAVPA